MCAVILQGTHICLAACVSADFDFDAAATGACLASLQPNTGYIRVTHVGNRSFMLCVLVVARPACSSLDSDTDTLTL